MVKVMFLENGNTIGFNQKGEQVPELQKSWGQLYFEFLQEKGINPLDVDYILPNGKIAKVFKTEDGYNWEIE